MTETFLPMMSPRFEVIVTDKHTFTMIDDEGDIAYFSARGDVSYIHPHWSHLRNLFETSAKEHFAGKPFTQLTNPTNQ